MRLVFYNLNGELGNNANIVKCACNGKTLLISDDKHVLLYCHFYRPSERVLVGGISTTLKYH
jgi:hypothetical protein